jgi:hypothetical protein
VSGARRRPSPSRRLLRPPLIAAGAVLALIAGGGVLAFAGWTTRTTSQTFIIQAARIPQIPKPAVIAALTPVIQWKSVKIDPNLPVSRYIVTRHVGKATRIVCSLPATLPRQCLDLGAPANSALTYSVYATQGARWIGVDSEPSTPISTTGSLTGLAPSDAPVSPGAATPAPGGAADPGTPVTDATLNSLAEDPTVAPSAPSSGYVGSPTPAATEATAAAEPTASADSLLPDLPLLPSS